MSANAAADYNREVIAEDIHGGTVPVIAADAASIMAVISRAAQDPSTDVDKLERLLGMYERITSRSAEQAFHESMNAVQAKMKKVLARKRNSQTNSLYATFDALDAALRPLYTEHGFSLSFNTAAGAPDNHVRITCRVSHVRGHSADYQADIPADGKGAKGGDVMTKTHATGAAMTYGQRYLFKLIFNVAVGTDNDGNAPERQQTPPRATPAPEGADFWDCEGPGMSAHQAKKEGLDVVHDAMREGIGQQFTAAAMNQWIDNNLDTIRRMPRSWRVILRQAVDEQADAHKLDGR